MSRMDDIKTMEEFQLANRDKEDCEAVPMNLLASQGLYNYKEMRRIEDNLTKHMKEEREIRKNLNRFRKRFYQHTKAFKVLVRERERELREQSERGK